MHCRYQMNADGLHLRFGDTVKEPGRHGRILGKVVRIIENHSPGFCMTSWKITFKDKNGGYGTRSVAMDENGIVKNRKLVFAGIGG